MQKWEDPNINEDIGKNGSVILQWAKVGLTDDLSYEKFCPGFWAFLPCMKIKRDLAKVEVNKVHLHK